MVSKHRSVQITLLKLISASNFVARPRVID